jgi:mono/diheme cytochrome c family protein
MRKSTLAVLVGVSALGAAKMICLAAAQDDGRKAAADTAALAEAGAMFQKNCISCHRPPDLKFAADRAWLDQLNRTA